MSFVPFSICNAPAASGALCPAISPFLIINAQSVKYLDTAMEKGDGASKKISAIRRHINCERKLSTSLQMVALAFLGACYEDCEHVLTTAMSVCKSPLNRKPSGSVLTR